jgi:hypothetical protein
MRGFRLNGWQRIGIVLSVLWAIGAWLYMEAAAFKAAQEAMTVISDMCIRNKTDRNDFDFKPCFDQANDIRQTTFGDWSAWAWPVALVPIPIIWVLVYLLLSVVRWIRRGFQPST